MRTSALRLSIVYAASFAAALVALVFVIYLLTTRFIDAEVDTVIERDAMSILEAFGRGGTRGLIAELDLRERTFSRINAVYLLTDAEGFVIAGNLPAWPAMSGRDGGWVEFEIELREGDRQTGRPVRAMVLEPGPGLRLLVGTDLSDRRDLGRRFAVAAGIGTLLVTLIALGIGYRQSQRILARVEAMSRTCKDIVGGNLAGRLPVTGDDDEFDTLAVEVNSLLARLARTTDILRTSLHSAAHDLRSPMHRMRLRMEEALGGEGEPSPADVARRETLDLLLRDVDQMQRVLTALLQIAEAESGTVGARPEPVDLKVMVDELAELYQPQADEQGIALSVDCAPGARVLGHRQLLAQAIANLMDNALKFTPAGGRVEVRTGLRDGRLEISVADSGPGIPAEDRARAVEPFVRLANAPPRDGSGLGLNLAAAVARLHGGRLSLEENRPGLVARLELPAVPAGARPGYGYIGEMYGPPARLECPHDRLRDRPMTAALASSPPAPATSAELAPTGLNVRRLIWIRMIAVPGSALCLLLARQIYNLPIPALQMILIVIGLAAFNFWVWVRHKASEPVTDREFFIQLLVDLFALTSILYYTGGASNPFVYFFVLPMIISAAALPQTYTWVLAGLSALAYTVLMLWRVEVPEFINMHGRASMDLHAAGMWIGFIVLSLLIATFVAAMAQTVRERDHYLARLRESALRDERVLAVATLAAGAAHELSTPLATMAVVTGEIAREYPAATHPALNRDLGILRDQIARCKEALSVISASAGAARADAAERLTLDQFVRQAVAEVCRLRPGSAVRVVPPATPGPSPALVVERTVRQALLNILHNAVDVSPRDVRVATAWSATGLEIAVIDRGGGLRSGQPGSLERLGVSTKAGGLGLGLFLSHAAVTQAGGSLDAANNDEGGTTVRLRLPLAPLPGRLTENAA